jgi:hypothetical protein
MDVNPPPAPAPSTPRRQSVTLAVAAGEETTPSRVADVLEGRATSPVADKASSASDGAASEVASRARGDSFVTKPVQRQNFNSILSKKTQKRKGVGNQLTLYWNEGAGFQSKRANTAQIYRSSSSTVEVEVDSGADAVPLRPKPKALNVGQFGTWDGVCVSCLLNIFGVIMFLRVGFVVGHAGWLLAIVILLLSTVVTVITTWSMSAIVTNGEVKGGGAYYLISRSLGAAFGGSIGILFFVGLACAIAIYVIGFLEVLVNTDLALAVGTLVPDNDGFAVVNAVSGVLGLQGGVVINNMRIYGILLIVFILCMALIGVGWVINVQIGLLVLLVCAIFSIIIGSMWPREEMKVHGFVGWSWDNIVTNALPDYGVSDTGEQVRVLYLPLHFTRIMLTI